MNENVRISKTKLFNALNHHLSKELYLTVLQKTYYTCKVYFNVLLFALADFLSYVRSTLTPQYRLKLNWLSLSAVDLPFCKSFIVSSNRLIRMAVC